MITIVLGHCSVDRRKSVEVLRGFLSERSTKISEEVAWLRQAEIDCVLSDAVFLAWCVY
jgi:hypothetical protein